MYLQGSFRHRIRYQLKQVPNPSDPRFLTVVASLSDALTTSGFPTGFWIGADAIFAGRLQAIRQAQRTIHFETFIMTPGHRADDFAVAIAERAQAGVEVQLVVDSYGVKSMSESYWQRLRASGVEVRFFHPFSWKSPLDYTTRTHRKLLLIDGKVALIGGAGISDYWDGEMKHDKIAPWLDFEVRFEGPVVAILEGTFMQHWTYLGGIADMGPEVIRADLEAGYSMLVIPGDPSYRDSSVNAMFQVSIAAAKERVWIASPYLLPNTTLRRTLIRACQLGVDVRLLTMGPRNDKDFVYYASRELYQDLLKGGVQIYEYKPSMMHAKVLLVDSQWLSVGSANLDSRSLFHNDELNLSTLDPELAKNLEDFFYHAFNQSRAIQWSDWQARPLQQKLWGRFSLIFQRQL
jgi:cardiolipin synthase